MKKILRCLLTLFIVANSALSAASLFDAGKLYLIKTVLSSDYSYTYNSTSYSFVAGDTVIWSSNVFTDGSCTNGPKKDAIYPVKLDGADLSNLQYYWIIENDGEETPANYRFRNKYSTINSIDYQYITTYGSANDVYLNSTASSNESWFNVVETTENDNLCYNINVIRYSTNYLTNSLKSITVDDVVAYDITSANAPAAIFITEVEPLSPSATDDEKAILKTSMDSAIAILSSTSEGTALGDFEADDRTVLQMVIVSAQTVYDNSSATSLETSNALVDVNDAITTYFNTIIVDTNTLEDGYYCIKIMGVDGDYLYMTDPQPRASGDLNPVAFLSQKAKSDSLKSQVFLISKDGSRYRMDSPLRMDSGFALTYVNEKGLFGSNSYSIAWNTMSFIEGADSTFAIQKGGSAGSVYWGSNSDTVGSVITSSLNTLVKENLIFVLEKDYSILFKDSINIAVQLKDDNVDNVGDGKLYAQSAYDALVSAILDAQTVYNSDLQMQSNFKTAMSDLSDAVSVFNTSSSLSRDASLSSITIGGEVLADFVSTTYTYEVELVGGTTDVPIVAGTATESSSHVVVTDVASLSGTSTIVVTAEDGETKLIYSVIFTVSVIADPKLTSDVVIGHESSWGNNSATFIAAALDGDLLTYVDAASSVGYVGYDMGIGNKAQVTAVCYASRATYASRMIGGEIRGANLSDLSDAKTLYTITDEPSDNELIAVAIASNTAYRYVYYYSTNYCNIAEIEFYGKSYSYSNDTTLSDLKVDGITIDGFVGFTQSYDVDLSEGTTDVPVVVATANDVNANVEIIPATSLPGTTTIIVIAEDGESTATYNIKFSVSVVSVIDDNIERGISVVPTVSSGDFRVMLGLTGGIIRVYSMTGKLVREVKSNDASANVSLQESGMYLFRIMTSSGEEMINVLVK